MIQIKAAARLVEAARADIKMAKQYVENLIGVPVVPRPLHNFNGDIKFKLVDPNKHDQVVKTLLKQFPKATKSGGSQLLTKQEEKEWGSPWIRFSDRRFEIDPKKFVVVTYYEDDTVTVSLMDEAHMRAYDRAIDKTMPKYDGWAGERPADEVRRSKGLQKLRDLHKNKGLNRNKYEE